MELFLSNFLFKIFLVILILLGLFLGLVFINMLISKKDANASTKDILKFFQNVLSALDTTPEQASSYFNVLIGYNGHSVRGEIVEKYFEDLAKIYETIYFANCQWYTRNVVQYTFRAYQPLKFADSPQRLARTVKQVAEKALTQHFHRQGLAPLIDPFIAVIIQCDEVRVYIAANNVGFDEIAKLRQEMF